MKKNLYNTPDATWVLLEEDDILTTINSGEAGVGNVDENDPGDLFAL